jgi:hypothetical protein
MQAGEITEMLASWGHGDRAALDRLLPSAASPVSAEVQPSNLLTNAGPWKPSVIAR